MKYGLMKYPPNPIRQLILERRLLMLCCLILLAGWSWTVWQFVRLSETTRLNPPAERGHR